MSKPEVNAAHTVRLVRFNRHLLDQALALIALHEQPGAAAYAGPVGAHLRHLIEHFEALLSPADPGVVDYDSRPRDAELEAVPALAQSRIAGLLQALAVAERGAAVDQPLQVRGQCGAAGESGFEVGSTLGRELAFLASHTVHHFALLRLHCAQHGMALPADFGQAPSTLAHQRRISAAPPSTQTDPEFP